MIKQIMISVTAKVFNTLVNDRLLGETI